MADGSGAAPKLSISRTLRDTFLIPARHFREFSLALSLPALVIFVFSLGWNLVENGLPEPVAWALYFFYGLCFTVLAVAVHRLVLLGPPPEPHLPKLRWGWRETRFLGQLVVLGVILGVGKLVVMLGTANLVLLMGLEDTTRLANGKQFKWFAPLDYFALVVATCVTARLSLVLPATATDEPISFRQAWQQSAGNGWRLAIIVGVFPWLLDYGESLLYPQDPSIPALVSLVILSVVTLILTITALSFSYQDLRR